MCSHVCRQLLVIMELRCSEDYALFISQGVIEAYLRLFMEKVQQKIDNKDLGFTDYEVKLPECIQIFHPINSFVLSYRKPYSKKYCIYILDITNNVFIAMHPGFFLRKKTCRIFKASSSRLKTLMRYFCIE